MVEAIRANGWRQGSIFPSSAHSELQKLSGIALKDSDCCIVLSQSCDLLFADIAAEPVAEVVVATRLNSPTDGNYTHAKNARRLHFHVYEGDVPRAYDARIKTRFNIPKEHLAKYGPDEDRTIRPEELHEIVNWVMARYARHAFPDEFNKRIAVALEKKIKGALKGLPNLTAIYVALSTWDELPRNLDYKIFMLGTVKAEDYDNVGIRTALESGIARIAGALEACDGIIVDDFEIQSEASVTLDHLRNLTRWYFDYISLQDTQHHSMGPAR